MTNDEHRVCYMSETHGTFFPKNFFLQHLSETMKGTPTDIEIFCPIKHYPINLIFLFFFLH